MFVNENNANDPYGMNSLMSNILKYVEGLKQQLSKKMICKV